MKRILLFSLIAMLVGCSPVKFNIKEKPANLTKEQQVIDDLQCSKESERNGPWLYGIGNLIYREMAKSAYSECMAKRGYSVEPL
ncbi:hypothetical protein [Methylomicrobium sp. Wu6]|uniref:hypothetical protein n=1 Tax=Methylomicrobium sp. Wu6 TaxID=3107928 RepID=UPI002DD61E70|nr:hypothetical protein [Methylomicrobium sp. Wu6]MEC4749083.1 hypothetical protein [Methylomicrobium sp. Wu6]